MAGQRTIVLATSGSLGDLYPYVAIAGELRRRGHLPIIATSSFHRRSVDEAGIAFYEAGPDPTNLDDERLIRMATHPTRGSEYIIRRMILPSLEESYRRLAPLVEEADFVVAHPLFYAAKLAAEKHRVRWAAGILQPSLLFSVYDPPLLAGLPSPSRLGLLRRPFYAALFALIGTVTRRWAEPIVRLRRELGLPEVTVDPLSRGQFSDRLNLALFSPLLAPPQPDWPANTVATGFPFYRRTADSGDAEFVRERRASASGPVDGRDAGARPESTARLASAPTPTAARDPALEAFLDGGQPPVVFTLGSLAVLNAGRFFPESVRAAGRIGRRAVLLVGRDRLDEQSRLGGGDVFVTGFAPHSELFPRAAAVVHQGGIGTTAEALLAGRPMLVVPFSNDQPDNARRAARLGVARVVERRAYRAARVAAELERLLADPAYTEAAAATARRVAGEDGVQAACDALEAQLPD